MKLRPQGSDHRPQTDGTNGPVVSAQSIASGRQLLFFIDALAVEFGVRGPWTIWCSGRSVQPVVLAGFGERWAEPFQDAVDISYPLEDNFQIEQEYAGGGDAHGRTVREFATRFDLVFGSTKPRAYDYPGDDGSPLAFGRLNYT